MLSANRTTPPRSPFSISRSSSLLGATPLVRTISFSPRSCRVGTEAAWTGAVAAATATAAARKITRCRLGETHAARSRDLVPVRVAGDDGEGRAADVPAGDDAPRAAGETQLE